MVNEMAIFLTTVYSMHEHHFDDELSFEGIQIRSNRRTESLEHFDVPRNNTPKITMIKQALRQGKYIVPGWPFLALGTREIPQFISFFFPFNEWQFWAFITRKLASTKR